MFVNKRRFTFYLSKVYATIRTSLGNETFIDKILYSSFDTGKYVKHIHLSNIQKPKNLNELDVRNDRLGMIMKKTLNVDEVRLFRTVDQAKRGGQIYKDWLYFSVVLINTNCWKLKFLPTLGEDTISFAAYYYTCAYYSRHNLKRLELSFALETLEVHKNLINGLANLESLLQFTSKLQELAIRFANERVCQAIKYQHTACSSLKTLHLYNFTPKHNIELLTLAGGFSSIQNLYITGEKDKTWLGNINDPLAIDNFFRCIRSIPRYEIIMSGVTRVIEFSKPWLKFIKNCKEDINLSLSFDEKNEENNSFYKKGVVASFYGDSAQSTLFLKYTTMGSDQNISDSLRVMDSLEFSSLRITNKSRYVAKLLKQIIAKERTYLKQMVVSDCTLKNYTPRTDTTSVSQHLKRIIFRNCLIRYLPLKSFLNEFDSFDYIEFDSCAFQCVSSNTESSIDIGDTDIKSMRLENSRNSLRGKYTNDNIIIISIYFTTQYLTRYFSVIDDNLIENTKSTFNTFKETLYRDKVAVLEIKVKSLQELSLMVAKTFKIHKISFRSLA